MDASSRAQVAAFLAMDILSTANRMEASGRRVYHLETGQPGGRAPRSALDAARDALSRDALGYTEALGRPVLKGAIARLYKDRHGIDLDPSRIVITTGSSAGFILSFLALFEAGQGLAMASPGYPAYRNTALALDLRPVQLRAGADQNFRLDPQALRRCDGAHGLLIASPGNPTGTVTPPEELAAIADMCVNKGWPLISDEIYHGLTYGAPAETALRFAPDAIVINSFSKYFAMTGWRIGWMIVPEKLVRPIERLAQNLYISPPTISQVAALAALSPESLSELGVLSAGYKRNRDVLSGALYTGGLTHHAPADGAFYLYVNSRPLGSDSKDVAKRLLHDTGIAVTPGWDFDADEGGDWLRLSYAGSETDIREAASILKDWLRRG